MENLPCKVNIEDIPEGKTAEDYPEGTLFVWKDHEPIDVKEQYYPAGGIAGRTQNPESGNKNLWRQLWTG